MDEFHKVRQQLTAEMADNSGIIRNLVVRAEDARMMNNMSVVPSLSDLTSLLLGKDSSSIVSAGLA